MISDAIVTPLLIVVSLSIILYAVFIFSNVNISEAMFRSGFLRRTSASDERIVCRGMKFDPRSLERGSMISSSSSLLLVITTGNLDQFFAQILQHIELLSRMFKHVNAVVIAPFGREYEIKELTNVTLEFKFIEGEYGGRSRDLFDVYRYQWEEHYGLLYQNRGEYLMVVEVDSPGRIFSRGILESIYHLSVHENISGVGFRTVTPRGRVYPRKSYGDIEGGSTQGMDWRRFLPEMLPYGKGFVEEKNWTMGIHKLPRTELKRYINTNMIYLVGDN